MKMIPDAGINSTTHHLPEKEEANKKMKINKSLRSRFNVHFGTFEFLPAENRDRQTDSADQIRWASYRLESIQQH